MQIYKKHGKILPCLLYVIGSKFWYKYVKNSLAEKIFILGIKILTNIQGGI